MGTLMGQEAMSTDLHGRRGKIECFCFKKQNTQGRSDLTCCGRARTAEQHPGQRPLGFPELRPGETGSRAMDFSALVGIGESPEQASSRTQLVVWVLSY